MYPRPARKNASGTAPPFAVIIGAQEAGTTTLFQLLASHPGIRVSNKTWMHSTTVADTPLKVMQRAKDKHFFNWTPDMVTHEALETYLRNFFTGPLDKARKTLLDGTADYFSTAFTPCALKAAFPTAKLVLVLRDPVARTFSHWRHINERNMWMLPTGLIKGKPLAAFPEEVKAEQDWLKEQACTFTDSTKGWNDCFQCNTHHCALYYSTYTVRENMCDFNAGRQGVGRHV